MEQTLYQGHAFSIVCSYTRANTILWEANEWKKPSGLVEAHEPSTAVTKDLNFYPLQNVD